MENRNGQVVFKNENRQTCQKARAQSHGSNGLMIGANDRQVAMTGNRLCDLALLFLEMEYDLWELRLGVVCKMA